MRSRRPAAVPEEIATIPLATPESVGQPMPFQDHSQPNRLSPIHVEPPPIPHFPAFVAMRRRHPLLLSLTVLVLASLFLGVGTLLAQQHISKPTHQQAGGASEPTQTTGKF